MIHFSIPDGCITKSILCIGLFTGSQHPNIAGQLDEFAPKLSSRANFSVARLGCAETVSDFIHRVGHCDLKCSGSTSEIPPLAMEVLPNFLDNKTYSRLAFCGLLPLLLAAATGAGSSSPPPSGPDLSANMFPLPTRCILTSLRHPLQQYLCFLPSSILSTCPKSGDLLQQVLLGAWPCSRSWL